MYTHTFRNAVRQAAATAGVSINQDWTNDPEPSWYSDSGRRDVIFRLNQPVQAQKLLKTLRRSVGNVIANDKELNLRVSGKYIKASCALSR